MIIFIKKCYWFLLLLILNSLSALMLCYHQQIRSLTVDPRGSIFLTSDIAMSWGTMTKKLDASGKTQKIQLKDYHQNPHPNSFPQSVNELKIRLYNESVIHYQQWSKEHYLIVKTKTLTHRNKTRHKYDIVKLNWDGAEKWRFSIPVKKLESVGGLGIDNGNNLVAAINTRWGYSLVKLDPSGRLLWRKNINPKKSMIWMFVFSVLWVIRSGIKIKLVGYEKFLKWLSRLKTMRWRRGADA